MPSRPLTPAERLGARFVTGPLGHLYAGLVDWVALAGRVAWAKVRGRPLW